jgi:hypothetical protein
VAPQGGRIVKISRCDVVIIVVVVTLLLFGSVSFEVESLKLDTFEAQHVELQVKGILSRAQQ